MGCLCLALVLLLSCREETPEQVLNRRVEQALALAGNNRQELEKVLEHYKADSLKLQAARFLIGNMPGHGGYEDARIDSMKAVMRASAEANVGGYLDNEWKRKWLREFDYRLLEKQEDVKTVTARLLIDNIDQAFRVWQECPWKDSYTFADFCEWVLPYRIGDEPLECWRQAYYERYKPLMDSLYTGTDPVAAVDTMARYFKKHNVFILTQEYRMPHLGAQFLSEHLIGTCREITDHAVYIFRALGIPIKTDHYWYSPSNQHDHMWNVLKTPEGDIIPFWYMDDRDFAVRRGETDGRKKGKVYREMYAAQEERTTPLFGPFFHDATADYFGHNSYRVKTAGAEGESVLLGMFTPRGYVPVDVAPLRWGKARVEDIEPEVIFQPMQVRKNGMQAAVGYPFMATAGGKLHYFKPDPDRRDSVRLLRKYPLRKYIAKYMTAMTGARMEASNDRDFRTCQPLCQLTDTIRTNVNYYYPELEQACRYVRFTPAP